MSDSKGKELVLLDLIYARRMHLEDQDEHVAILSSVKEATQAQIETAVDQAVSNQIDDEEKSLVEITERFIDVLKGL